MEMVEKDARTIEVRELRPADLEAVVRVDARIVGRRRDEYFKLKLRENLDETGIKMSLAAEQDGCFCGFLLARVYYGEFGTLEPVAVLDTIGVHPDFRGRRVGSEMLRQLRLNLSGLGVQRLQTEVAWNAPELITFFNAQGFRPAQRIALDLDLE